MRLRDTGRRQILPLLRPSAGGDGAVFQLRQEPLSQCPVLPPMRPASSGGSCSCALQSMWGRKPPRFHILQPVRQEIGVVPLGAPRTFAVSPVRRTPLPGRGVFTGGVRLLWRSQSRGSQGRFSILSAAITQVRHRSGSALLRPISPIPRGDILRLPARGSSCRGRYHQTGNSPTRAAVFPGIASPGLEGR